VPVNSVGFLGWFLPPRRVGFDFLMEDLEMALPMAEIIQDLSVFSMTL
jgi:hypothetical protein